MIHEIISFKTAMLAKLKGYPYNSFLFGGYHDNGKFSYEAEFGMADDEGYHNPNNSIGASPQNLLQKWLREEHGIIILIQLTPGYPRCYYSYIYNTKNNIILQNTGNGKELKYEGALEASLYRALDLISNE